MAAAVLVAWVTTGSSPDHLVRVVTASGERCGQFLGSGPDGVALRTDSQKRAVVPVRTVLSVVPARACGAVTDP
ncbi:hypothetical protein [Streptomyces sp. NPDC002671]